MRALKAIEVQPKDDPARVLAEARAREVRKAVIALLYGLIGLFAGEVVLKMLSRLDSQSLSLLLSSQEADDIFISGYQPIADTFLEAARQAANSSFGALVPYDPLKAALALQDLRNSLAQAITMTAKQVIQQTILAGFRSGADPARMAMMLRQVIGLDARSAQAVQNYRRLLEQGDLTALSRALRDGRFDDLVREAARGGSPLTQGQIDTMVQAYADRLLDNRATTIARTEAMQAAVSGIRDAHVQAVNSGRLFNNEVKRFWLTAHDELVCPICTSVPVMNEDGVRVNEDYKSVAGPIEAPLAHPRCRCSERYVANTTRLTQQPFALAA